MKPDQKLRISEPPLTTEEHVEIDPDTGEKIRVTIIRRGILGIESKTYQSLLTWAKTCSGISPKAHFESLCEALRDRLEKWGLPSDRQPKWAKLGDADWEPYPDDKPINFDIRPASYEYWWSRMKALTEPLSEQRCVGEFLYELARLLERPGIESHLWNIGRCMDACSTLRIAGATNFFAAAGLAAHNGRAIGPTAKQKQAEQRREIIWSIANKFWSKSPIHRYDAANTAAAIASEANQMLRATKLLPPTKNGLSVKTISDYIRTSISGKSI